MNIKTPKRYFINIDGDLVQVPRSEYYLSLLSFKKKKRKKNNKEDQ